MTRLLRATRYTFRAMTVRNYRLYFVGQLISTSGTWMQTIAQAWLVFEPTMTTALGDLRVGREVLIFTWLHHDRRDVLAVNPRGDRANPDEGVFTTRHLEVHGRHGTASDVKTGPGRSPCARPDCARHRLSMVLGL
jgi:hypothetical protein